MCTDSFQDACNQSPGPLGSKRCLAAARDHHGVPLAIQAGGTEDSWMFDIDLIWDMVEKIYPGYEDTHI